MKCPPKMCSFCNKEGHLDKDCPQDSLPKLEALPEMTSNWRNILDTITIQIMGNYLVLYVFKLLYKLILNRVRFIEITLLQKSN